MLAFGRHARFLRGLQSRKPLRHKDVRRCSPKFHPHVLEKTQFYNSPLVQSREAIFGNGTPALLDATDQSAKRNRSPMRRNLAQPLDAGALVGRVGLEPAPARPALRVSHAAHDAAFGASPTTTRPIRDGQALNARTRFPREHRYTWRQSMRLTLPAPRSSPSLPVRVEPGGSAAVRTAACVRPKSTCG